MVRVQLARSYDPRAAGPGTMLIPEALVDLRPRLAGVTESVNRAAEALRTLAILMNDALLPQCPCPGPLHTMRCGLGGRAYIIREEGRMDCEELDPTECVDGDGEPYPEHDFPEDSTECRRCGVECDDIE